MERRLNNRCTPLRLRRYKKGILLVLLLLRLLSQLMRLLS